MWFHGKRTRTFLMSELDLGAEKEKCELCGLQLGNSMVTKDAKYYHVDCAIKADPNKNVINKNFSYLKQMFEKEKLTEEQKKTIGEKVEEIYQVTRVDVMSNVLLPEVFLNAISEFPSKKRIRYIVMEKSLFQGMCLLWGESSPVYGLFEENDEEAWEEFFNSESIPEISGIKWIITPNETFEEPCMFFLAEPKALLSFDQPQALLKLIIKTGKDQNEGIPQQPEENLS